MMPRSPTAADARRTHIVELNEAKSRGSTQPGEVMIARRVACECTLDRLWAQGHLGRAEQADAAERRWRAGMVFRSRWRSATRQPRIVANLTGEQAGRGDSDDAASSQATASKAIRRACEAIGMACGGSAALTAVIAVAGQDESATRRLAALIEGLDVLAEFWQVRIVETRTKSGPEKC